MAVRHTPPLDLVRKYLAGKTKKELKLMVKQRDNEIDRLQVRALTLTLVILTLIVIALRLAYLLYIVK